MADVDALGSGELDGLADGSEVAIALSLALADGAGVGDVAAEDVEEGLLVPLEGAEDGALFETIVIKLLKTVWVAAVTVEIVVVVIVVVLLIIFMIPDPTEEPLFPPPLFELGVLPS